MLSFREARAIRIKFPSLMIPGGDVLIELSGDPNDSIILPKAYIRRSGYFASSLSDMWNNHKHKIGSYAEMNNPITGQAVRIARFVLTFVRDNVTKKPEHSVLVIERGSSPRNEHWTKEVFPCSADEYPGELELHESTCFLGPETLESGVSIPFHESSLGEGFENAPPPEQGWPRLYRRRSYSHKYSILAHKLLFTYVLDKRPSFEEAKPDVEEEEIIADCICLAHYYDLDHLIAPNLARDIREMSGFWERVVEHPRYYLQLAAMLKDQELFEESFRCYLGSHYKCLEGNPFARPPSIYHVSTGSQDLSEPPRLPTVSGWDDAKADSLLAKYHKRLQELAPKQDIAVRKQFAMRGNLLKNTVLPNYTNEDDALKAGLLAIGIASEWYNTEVTKEWSRYRYANPMFDPTPTDQQRDNPFRALAVFEEIFTFSKKPQSERIELFGEDIHKHLKMLTDSDPDSNFHYGSWDKAREKAARNAIESLLEDFIIRSVEAMDAVLEKHESASRAGNLNFFTHFVFDAEDVPWDVMNPWPEHVRQRVVDTSWADAVWAATDVRGQESGGGS